MRPPLSSRCMPALMLSSVVITFRFPPRTFRTDLASMPSGERLFSPSSSVSLAGVPVVVMSIVPPLMVMRGSGSSFVSGVRASLQCFQPVVMPLSWLRMVMCPSLMATKPSGCTALSLPLTLMPLPAGASMVSRPPSMMKAWVGRKPSRVSTLSVRLPLLRRRWPAVASAWWAVASMLSEPSPRITSGPVADRAPRGLAGSPWASVRRVRTGASARVLWPCSSMKAVAGDCRCSAGPSVLLRCTSASTSR